MTFEQLADILCDMVAQSCSTRIPDEVDSSCIGTHAEAIEALIELGYAERVGPSAGRQIRARLIPPEERRATVLSELERLTGMHRAAGESFGAYVLRVLRAARDMAKKGAER